MATNANWFKNRLNALNEDFDFRLEKIILDITEKITNRMKQKKLSRVKLASKLDISPPAVTKILDGSSNFTLRTLLSLADALDADLFIEFKGNDVFELKPKNTFIAYGSLTANDYLVNKTTMQFSGSSSVEMIKTDEVHQLEIDKAAA